MVFELFLTKCQNMYNIFEEEDKPMEADYKTHFLFKWIYQSDLQKPIEALKANMATKPSGTV